MAVAQSSEPEGTAGKMARKKGGGGGGDEGPRGPGAKAKAQKLAAQKAKEQQAHKAKEARVAKQWEDGANSRAEQRQREAEEKEKAKLAAAQAKKEALAADEAGLAKMRVPAGKARKASKKKSKNDTSLLDAFLEGEKKEAKEKAARKAAQASGSAANTGSAKPAPANVEPMLELQPNLNRERAEEAAQGHISASGIDAALAAFEASGLGGSSSSEDKHHAIASAPPGAPAAAQAHGHKGPNRKALFSAYEEREIARLRAENPGLKRSQLKDHVWKLWQKSPENPANQVEDNAA
ncbi:Coiled-coil domain-containing protein 124-like [Hondaea fermentalgiana]|uniref:Coiled-coil domain-containing protein 124-like n=1 Tax=Hondaea fermentalgiana TaxID=2315210 RepID=A0A2R5G0Y4_9STRA|nr:Coiled-coil domain-containing protein 124-like [Hondaea fermentalgiana]|eukprot:GBG24185.1 Coiled-coil domain-containing protein 124-like [Hondaea fermentalgiana]